MILDREVARGDTIEAAIDQRLRIAPVLPTTRLSCTPPTTTDQPVPQKPAGALSQRTATSAAVLAGALSCARPGDQDVSCGRRGRQGLRFDKVSAREVHCCSCINDERARAGLAAPVVKIVGGLGIGRGGVRAEYSATNDVSTSGSSGCNALAGQQRCLARRLGRADAAVSSSTITSRPSPGWRPLRCRTRARGVWPAHLHLLHGS